MYHTFEHSFISNINVTIQLAILCFTNFSMSDPLTHTHTHTHKNHYVILFLHKLCTWSREFTCK